MGIARKLQRKGAKQLSKLYNCREVKVHQIKSGEISVLVTKEVYLGKRL